MTNLTPIGNMGGIQGPSTTPDPFPGQQSIAPPGAQLRGISASPSPIPNRGLNAAASADGSGLPAPELPALDTEAMNERPYGPWPGSSRDVSGRAAAPGPQYMTGLGADPGPRPVTGLAAASGRELKVGNRDSLERRINPNRGPVVRIPVDPAGRFGEFPGRKQALGVPNQNMPMGVPTFGNIGAMTQKPKIDFG